MASGSNSRCSQRADLRPTEAQGAEGLSNAKPQSGSTNSNRRRDWNPKPSSAADLMRAAHFSVSDDDVLGRVSIPEIHLVDMGQSLENRSDHEKSVKVAHTATSQHRPPSWKPGIECPAVVRDCVQSLLLHIEVSHCRRSSGGH